MLNLLHVHQLQTAICLILGNHDNIPAWISKTNLSTTQYIQKGQQMLHNLRVLPTYGCLLANYLAQSQNSNQYQSVNMSMGLSIGQAKMLNNSRMFVLIELGKIARLENESIWWHILQFYFSCTEKMESLIIDIIVKHFKTGQNPYTNIYRSFINYIVEPIKSCTSDGQMISTPMPHMSKMLNLVYHIIQTLSGMIDWDLYEYVWKYQHIAYLANTLQSLLVSITNACESMYAGYIQTIMVYIFKLLMLQHRLTTSSNSINRNINNHMDNGDEEQGLSIRLLSTIDTIIQSSANAQNHQFSAIVPTLLYLSAKASQIRLKSTCNYQPANIPRCIQAILKQRPCKNSHHVQAFKIIAYFVLAVEQNRKQIGLYSRQLLSLYYEYIINVQANHPLLLEQPNQVQGQQGHLYQLREGTDTHNFNLSLIQQHITISNLNSVSPYCKYILLSQCIKQNIAHLLETMLKKCQLNPMIYLAYIPSLQYLNLSSYQKQEMAGTVLVYMRSCINHSSQSGSLFILKCCLRYLYRFVIENPQFELIQICIALLNLRIKYPDLQHSIDILLCRATPVIITCCQFDKIWEFAQIWVCNLRDNYMDVNALSCYPILLILQVAQQYKFIQTYSVSKYQQQAKIQQYRINIPFFLLQTLQLIMQQTDNDANKTAHKHNNRINTEHTICSSFEIFYKLAGVIVKYLVSISKFYHQQTSSNHQAYHRMPDMVKDHKNKDIYIPKYVAYISQTKSPTLSQLIKKTVSFTFRNELYSTDTAYIYLFELINKNNRQDIHQFMTNMMTRSFWRGLQYSDIVFYACVFCGVAAQYNCTNAKVNGQNSMEMQMQGTSQGFDEQGMCNNLNLIIKQLQQTQALVEQNKQKINEQISDFIFLFKSTSQVKNCTQKYRQITKEDVLKYSLL